MGRLTWAAGVALVHMALMFLVTSNSFADGNSAPGESLKESHKNISSSGWNTYRNEKYRFELRYPTHWSLASDTDPVGGQRWLEQVILKDHPVKKREITLNEYRDIYIKIYKAAPEDIGKSILIKNMTTDEYHFGQGMTDSCLSSTATTNVLSGLVEISISDSNPHCFSSGAYFFSAEKDGYIFNIVPVPLRGIGYVGYDGKKMVAGTFPEFFGIISTFRFIK